MQGTFHVTYQINPQTGPLVRSVAACGPKRNNNKGSRNSLLSVSDMIGSFFPALREPWIVSLAMPEKKKKKKRPFLNYYTPYWTTNPLQV